MVLEIIISAVKVVVIVTLVLSFLPFFIWMERKVAAYIQDRRGPNRADILGFRMFGLFHPIADAIKLFTKEEIIPSQASRAFFIAAPMIAMAVPTVTIAVIPLAAPVSINNFKLNFQIADLNIGLLYILAIGSLGVYGTLLAGWSSGSRYPLLGSLRASAQMISYEVAMGLAIISVILVSGSVRLFEIVTSQGIYPWNWNFVKQPVAFLIFIIALFAEANRNPFDLPEGESEIVAGYHTEYSSMKFALFFMGEYAHMTVGSMFLAALFLGGFEFPFVNLSDWFHPAVVALIQVITFFAKSFFFCFFFVWVRWTLPRFRYDQLMGLGWRLLVPLALLNIVATTIILAWWRS